MLGFLPYLLCIFSVLKFSEAEGNCAALNPEGEGEGDVQVQVEVLSWSPRVFLYRNFLPVEHLLPLLEEVKPLIESASRSTTFREGDDDLRTSTTLWLPRKSEARPPVLPVIQAIHNATHLPQDHGEELQIVRYLPGQKYEFHHDTDKRMARVATALIYLTTVEKGGETIFPFVRVKDGNMKPPLNPMNLHAGITDMKEYCDSDEFLKVKPVAGDMLLFYDMTPGLQIDEAAWHGACPVVKGEKIAVQRWIKHMPDPRFQSAFD